MLSKLSERTKVILLGLLLLIMMGCLAFSAVSTVQAVKSFQHQYVAVKTGDVSTIHPWMTVHVISHVYAVPENYLYQSLQVSPPTNLRHATLYDIASRKKQPVQRVIGTIQHAILVYRQHHPHKSLTPEQEMQINTQPLALRARRAQY